MPAVTEAALPPEALLQRYNRPGCYTDCFRIDAPVEVSLPRYIEAFYTTALFRSERFILRWLVARPSSDDQAAALGRGEIDRFAAWSVEARGGQQILLSDFRGRTRSWLMVKPGDDNGAPGTTLYFGSAVVPADAGNSAETLSGPSFRVLLRFHRWYSIALLTSAQRKLRRQIAE